jgi:hypothetical protein
MDKKKHGKSQKSHKHWWETKTTLKKNECKWQGSRTFTTT